MECVVCVFVCVCGMCTDGVGKNGAEDRTKEYA